MIESYSTSKTKKKEKIMKWIRDKVDYSREEEGKPYTFHKDVSFSDCQLPCMSDMKPELRGQYRKTVIDEDMQFDLERCHSVNSFCQALKLSPIRVSRDGNCLLHAASVAVWGVEDHRGTLRDLMLMTVQINNNFKKRWQVQVVKDLHLCETITSEICNKEWDDVIRSISNLGSTGLSAAVPHRFLESVHIYILANILRRPIIVVTDRVAKSLSGHDLQENQIGGLYLPLEWSPSQCCKTPIVLGFSFSHFSPLISEAFSSQTTQQLIRREEPLFPLVNSDMGFLVIKYLREQEDPRAWDLAQEYLLVKEVNILNNDGTITKVPFAKMTLKPLDYTINPLFEHKELLCKKMSEAKFHESSRGQLYTMLDLSQQRNHPYYDIEMNSQTEVVSMKGKQGQSQSLMYPRQTSPMRIPENSQNLQRQCINDSCTKAGSDLYKNFCSGCFKILSLAVNPIEAQFPLNPSRDYTAAGYTTNNQELIPESFLNSTEHHPLVATAPLDSMQEKLELPSMMSERCKCGYRCSRQTYPYCHECYQTEVNERRICEPGTVASEPLEKNFKEIVHQPEDKCCPMEGTYRMKHTEALNMKTSTECFLTSLESTGSSSCCSLDPENMRCPYNQDMQPLLVGKSYFSKKRPEAITVWKCKNFEHCGMQKMLDRDTCFRCAEGQKNFEHINEYIQNKPHQHGTSEILRNFLSSSVEQTQGSQSEDSFQGFAETNAKNINGDIEVSEEPICKVKCVSPYCQTFILPPDKLCDSCKDILKRGYEGNQEYVNKGNQTSEVDPTTKAEKDLRKENMHKGNTKFLTDFEHSEQPSELRNSKFFFKETSKSLASQVQTQSHSKTSGTSNIKFEQQQQLIKGEHCIMPSCENYGDPAMGYMCSSCYFESEHLGRHETETKTTDYSKEIVKKHTYKNLSHEGFSLPQNIFPGQTQNLSYQTASHMNYQAHPKIYDFSQDVQYPFSVSSMADPHMVSSSALVTSKTGYSSYESLPKMPAYHPDFDNQNVSTGFEKTFQDIEETCKSSVRKCVNVSCQNYGNRTKEGYCNACFKVIRHQRIIAHEAQHGIDVPDI